MAGINTTNAVAREQAKQEIDLKKALELYLIADLILYMQQLAEDNRVVYTATGKVLSLNESYVDELKALLKKNYRKVADNFSNITLKQIEDTVDFDKYEIIPEKESDVKSRIAMAIGAYLLLRSNDIAPKIANTIQEELLKKTNDIIIDNASRGLAISNAEIANKVTNEFAEWGIKHTPVISVTEVQEVSETSKFTENSTLVNFAMEDEIDVRKLQAGAKKVWITAGDERVRKSHAEIDGKMIDAEDVFVTGMGGRMRYAGDMSLGASLADVINCRCETIYRYNTEIIATIKNKIYRRKGK